MSILGGVLGAVGTLATGAYNWFSSNHSAKQQYNYQTQLNAQGYNYSKKLQDAQNEFNYKTFQEENAFNKEMFNKSSQLAASAHQIEVQDLRNAGLNPILSATGGNGASVVSPVQSATTSSGSATMSGGSASGFQKHALSMENFWRGMQYDLDDKKNDSDIALNKETENLNRYLGDKAHYESALARENTQLLQEYGARLKMAELASIEAGTAKTLNSIKLDTQLANSQMDVNSSQAWRNRHQALGFSESYSDSYSDGKNAGLGSVGLKAGPFAGNLPSFNGGKTKSRSYSRSRTY